MRGGIAMFVALAMLAGCRPAETGGGARPRIVGLAQADGASFTVSPDGGALSILYDTLVVRGQDGAAPKRLEQSRRLTIVASKPGRATFDIRGAHLGDPARLGELGLVAGGQKATLKLVGGDAIRWRVTMPLGPSTPVTLTARFAASQPGPAEIHIDSIDIAVAR